MGSFMGLGLSKAALLRFTPDIALDCSYVHLMRRDEKCLPHYRSLTDLSCIGGQPVS